MRIPPPEVRILVALVTFFVGVVLSAFLLFAWDVTIDNPYDTLCGHAYDAARGDLNAGGDPISGDVATACIARARWIATPGIAFGIIGLAAAPYFDVLTLRENKRDRERIA